MTLTESQKLSITRTGRRVDKSSSKMWPPPVPIHSAVFFCRQIVFTLPEYASLCFDSLVSFSTLSL